MWCPRVPCASKGLPRGFPISIPVGADFARESRRAIACGRPARYDGYIKRNRLGNEDTMKVSIASDHAGFEEKELLKPYIESLGHEVCDRGPQSADRVDYPDFAKLVADDVASGAADRGVLVCGTGIGMAIAANKVHGVRAANVTTPDFAALAREHNDANIVTLSGRFVTDEVNRAIVKTFFETEFGGGRHAGRVAKIMALEEK
ncbi:MAG: ribose 5-phosphate isomerase B [Eggerthellaceae bacterium]|jgi:ribose 5-phosphate isomerase B